MTTTDYEHGVVPQDQRKSWLSIATVWIAIGIDLSGAFLGVSLASGMAFWPAISATMLGSLLLGLLAMACAYVGAATGLSTAMISRAVFGRIGGAILALAIAVSLVGWYAVQAGFFGANAQIAFAEFTGIDVPVQVFTAIGGVLMAITAFWGYRSINRLSTLAVPLLLLLLVVGVIVAFTVNGAAGLQAPVEATFTFGGAVSLVMGIFILGVVLAPDMARWAKTPKQAMIAGFVGFFFGNSIILVVAILLARIMDGTELMAIFFALGLGGVAVIVLILAQWTTNTTNLYSAGLSFASISERLSRRTVTIVLGRHRHHRRGDRRCRLLRAVHPRHRHDHRPLRRRVPGVVLHGSKDGALGARRHRAAGRRLVHRGLGGRDLRGRRNDESGGWSRLRLVHPHVDLGSRRTPRGLRRVSRAAAAASSRDAGVGPRHG